MPYTLYSKICSTFIIFQNVIKIFYKKFDNFIYEQIPENETSIFFFYFTLKQGKLYVTHAKRKKKKLSNGLNNLLSYSHAPSPNVFV